MIQGGLAEPVAVEAARTLHEHNPGLEITVEPEPPTPPPTPPPPPPKEPIVLRFDGVVGDADLDVQIGGRWVIDEIYDRPWDGDVTVALADDRFTGKLDAWPGLQGYSEWTPGEPAKLMVGDHDLYRRLEELTGKTVTLWISDGPINLLDT